MSFARAGIQGAFLCSVAAWSGAEEVPLRVRVTGQMLIQHDLRAVAPEKWAAVTRELRGTDVLFTDLETVIDTGAGRPTRDTVFSHAAKPAVLDCLRDGGFNLLALGNNHSWDLGADGVLATLREVDARGFVHAGTGADLAAASAPAILSTPRGRVALVACASGKIAVGAAATAERAGVHEVRLGSDQRIERADEERVLAAIRAARATADVVLVYQHDHYWEQDNRVTPEWKQRFARACIDAGGDLFVSHGAPLLHGIEVYRGRPILYNLGSLVFHTKTAPGYYTPETWQSAVVDADFSGGRMVAMRVRPVQLNERGEGAPPEPRFYATRGAPTFVTGAEARAILERLATLSERHGTPLRLEGDQALWAPAPTR